jgi:chromosome segregation ATPase
MSVASKLLGTPSHEDIAAVRAQAQVRASEDAQRIRELEKQLRDKEGEVGDRGRQLGVAKQRVKDLESELDHAKTLGAQREWQMEQHRERARQMLQLAQAAIQPVQSDAKETMAPGPVFASVQGSTDIRSLPQNALFGAQEQDR